MNNDDDDYIYTVFFILDLNNALRIVVYPETFIYRAERPEDKIGLLNAYRRMLDNNDDSQMEMPQSGKIKLKKSINHVAMVN
jgi:hypothetical protein